MSVRPLVTVLMSVHNDIRFVGEAVASILAQSFGDFEFLILDDASTDGSAAVLRHLNDARIRLYRNPDNLGLTRSLNAGLDRAHGRFIARMDADDVAEPHRLRRQVGFLLTNPDIGILGTSRTVMDERGRYLATASAPHSDHDIRRKCLLGNPFAHATVMLRRTILDRYWLRYDEAFISAQDYDLWSRMLLHTRGANLPDALLRYRLRNGISQTRKLEQLANHDRIALDSMRRLVPQFEISASEVAELRGRFGGESVRDQSMDTADPYWLGRRDELYAAFDTDRAEVVPSQAA